MIFEEEPIMVSKAIALVVLGALPLAVSAQTTPMPNTQRPPQAATTPTPSPHHVESSRFVPLGATHDAVYYIDTQQSLVVVCFLTKATATAGTAPSCTKSGGLP
jgi:hypothetical protein